MATATVRVILSWSLRPITLMSSPTWGYFFLNFLEFKSSSMARTMLSVSENGAKPTPKEVSLEAGIPSLPKTFTKSPDPWPILHSTTVQVSTSRLIKDSLRYSLAALIAILSIPIFLPSYSGTPRPVRRISMGVIISPPPNSGEDSPAVICTSSVLWWSTPPK